MKEARERAWALLEFVYGAIDGDAAVTSMLEALAGALDGEPCALLAGRSEYRLGGTLVAHGLDLSQIDPGELAQRPPTEIWDEGARPIGSVAPISKGASELAEHPLFEKLLLPLGVDPGPGLAVALGTPRDVYATALLILPRDGSYDPSERDVALLEALGPHLARAFAIRRGLAERDAASGALLAALDRLVMGVLLLDESGRVSFANRSVAGLLDLEPGLVDPADLASGGEERTKAFREMLAREGGPTEGALLYRHRESGSPLQVFSTPLRWDTGDGDAQARFATAIFVSDPRSESGEPVEVLRALYGLTPAESRLAILLLADYSVEDAAEHLGVTVGTARTTLKRVFAKTGTNRQASLVRLLMTGPGQLRRGHSGSES